VDCDSPAKRGNQEAEAEKADKNATNKPRTPIKQKGAERAAIRRRNKAAKSEYAKSKGRRTSRDNHRLASLLEANNNSQKQRPTGMLAQRNAPHFF
jgi:hypothetical protein